MREFLTQLAVDAARGLLVFVLLVAVVATVVAWGLSDFGAWWRYGAPAAAIVSVIGLRICVRRDKVPNFLSQIMHPPFDKAGLSFAPVLSVNDGVCWLVMYFQNKCERPCKAEVRVRPSVGFFLGKSAIPPLNIPVESGPAAFGAVFVPWGIPREYQATKQKFDITAAVEHPAGRGRTFQFGQGLAVGDHACRQSNTSYWASILLALSGHLHVSASEPAHISIDLPEGVAETLPENARISQQVFWQLGDELPAADSAGKLGGVDGRLSSVKA